MAGQSFSDVIAPALDQDGNVRRRHQLLVETVDVKLDKLLAYVHVLFPQGWRYWLRGALDVRHVCSNRLLTSRPGRLVHVWRVDWEFSLAEFQATLYEVSKDQPWIETMFESLESVTYELLMPTHYDPARCWVKVGAASCACEEAPTIDPGAACIDQTRPIPPWSPTKYRLLDVIDLLPGELSAVADAKRRCFLENARRYGITLHASGTALGKARRLVQIWNLPQMDALVEAINTFSDKGWYGDLFSRIDVEEQNLMVPFETDPNPKLTNLNCWQFPI